MHNATAGNLENMHTNTHKKEQNFQNPCNNIKMPRSPRDYGKNAVQVPPKLSEERRTVAFWPRVVLPVGEDEYVRD